MTGEKGMDTNRRIAVVAGVLFITATVADVISRVALVQPILSTPVDLAKISANETQVLLGALLLLIGAAAAHRGSALCRHRCLRAVAGHFEPGICERWSCGFIGP
jgi:hypothetical protein